MAAARLDESVDWALTWTAPDRLERSSHALAANGRVWLVDPVSDGEALGAAEGLGTVVAVLQLLDRHPRDCGPIAARYEVPHLRVPEQLPGTPFAVRRATWRPGWREVALWWPEHEALVVPESLGTAAYYGAGRGRLGVHPFLWLTPPRSLAGFAPQHLLPGHGPALHEGAAEALGDALAGSLREAPRAALAAIRAFATSRPR
jgi:hypothetical protein